MTHFSSPSIRRLAEYVAIVMAATVGVFLPLAYAVLAYLHAEADIEAESGLNAHLVTRIIRRDPDLWFDHEHELSAIIGEDRLLTSLPEQRRVVATAAGDRVVAQSPGELAVPVITRSTELMDFGLPVGRVEVSRSLQPLLLHTGGVAVIGMGLAAALFVVLRILPFRALDRTRLALFQHRQRAAATLSSIADGVVVCSIAGQVEYLNPVAERVLGCSIASARGRMLETIFPLFDTASRTPRPTPSIDTLSQGGGGLGGEAALHCLCGQFLPIEYSATTITDDHGRAAGMVVAFRDISERKKHERALRHQATHDALTGLPNRVLLNDRLERAIALTDHDARGLVVAFVDLDKFKLVNDTLGHAAGDQLLRTMAGRLSACVRRSDTVARMGGDEFVLLLAGHDDQDAPVRVLERVMDAVAKPVTLAGREIVLTCSIGFSAWPRDGRDADILLKNADTAMYRAKEDGRNRAMPYTTDMHTGLNARLALEGGLHQALARGEFLLHYQPQIEPRSGRIVALEALIRWQHPEQGLIAPGRFIPLAEENGLIAPIGEWVLRTACAQAKVWEQAGLGPLAVAVNLSMGQFARQNVCAVVRDALRDSGLDPRYLELELTESMSMAEPERSIAIMRELKDIGVSLAIDDFGTGYSNLSYLRRFPVNQLKLDRSFVQGMATIPENLAICRTVVALAHSLDLAVTAEGVENQIQLSMLADMGCDHTQGYYLCPPLSAEECTKRLHRTSADR